jgi:AraC-like DNA-binding protein
MVPLLMGAAGFPFAFWRLAKIVLEDETAIAPQAWAGLAALLASAMLAAPDYLLISASVKSAAAIANKVAALGFVGAALWGAWRSWEGDLFEPRRRLRRWLMGYIGAYGLVVMAGEIYLLGARPPVWLDLLNAAAIVSTLLATLLFFVQLRPAAMDTLFAPRVSSAPVPSKTAQPSADEPLLEKLHAFMEGEKLYRDPDLSVGSLAARAALPEYVLRRLVNERLGYRNFAAYVNDFRLREVEGRLRDPQWARRPILTLALEAGFGSIGPFNRAFRERYGMTPTAFRASGSEGESALGDAQFAARLPQHRR